MARQDFQLTGDAGASSVIVNPNTPVNPAFDSAFDLGELANGPGIRALGGNSPQEVEARRIAAEAAVQTYLGPAQIVIPRPVF